MKLVKSLSVFCLLAAFGAAVVGCEAEARVGDPQPDGTTVKKETTVERDAAGNVKKVETNVEKTP